MGRYGDIDYPKLTKMGVALGLLLLALGGGAELTAHALHYELPAWENTLFTDMEIVGILLFVLSPFVFGILLPLTE
ncbi:hypothetical protein [Halorarius halobius]|uniref:DUF7860 family protein n=1 Tax=Halorarius halobius TaxID=2962671 RepID=UPI0020CECB9A|nr:hypothetical protein [Halorarius halobius]